MFQGSEVIIILLLALVVLGPKRLPELAQKLGKWTAELRATAREVRQGLEAEVSDLKAPFEELKKPIEDLKKPIEEVKKDIEGTGVSRLDWIGPKPVSGPTPEEAMADLNKIEKKLEAEQETEDEGGA